MRFEKSIVYFSVLMLAMVQGMHADTVIGCVDVPGAYLSSCGFNYPQAIAITPNGLKAYVCNYRGNSVSVINLETNSVTDCVNVPDAYAACGFDVPTAIAITGTKAYVCNSGNSTVSVIDVDTDSVIDCVNASSCGFNYPYAIATTATKAYVCNLGGNSVSVIDLDTNSVIGCVDVPGTYSSCAFNAPIAIAITPDGTKAYVCNYGLPSVSVIDVNTDSVIDCVNVPDTYSPYCDFNEPYAIAITGTKAYVCNSANSTVSVIDLDTNSVIDCVDVPGAYSSCGLNNPQAIAITGTKAYVGNSGNATVSVIDLDTNSVIGCVDLPGVYSSCAFNDPIAIAITPDGTKAYVCNFSGNSVSIIGIPPFPPTNLSGCILQRGTTITNTLTWDAPTSGLLPNSYNIYRGSDLIATVSGYGHGPFAYEDPGLDPNTIYTYSIYSVYNGITSDDSANITLSVFCYPELFPPSAVSSSCSLENDTITWEAPTSGATPVEYEIYSDASLTHLIATVPAYGPGPFMYELTGLNPNMSYIYYIVSVDGYGNKSQPTSVTVGPCRSISPPASVSGCKRQDSFLLQTDYINNISWTAPTSGSSPVTYKIYRDAGLMQPVATVSASGSLQYHDHNRNPNDVYSYYIVSVDANGNVSIANSVTVTQSC
jgi:YVTN family beta-propeller protein